MNARLRVVAAAESPAARPPEPILLQRFFRDVGRWFARHPVWAALFYIALGAALAYVVRFYAPQFQGVAQIRREARLGFPDRPRNPCPPQTAADIELCKAWFKYHIRAAAFVQKINNRHATAQAALKVKYAAEAAALRQIIADQERRLAQYAAVVDRWKQYAGE